MTAIDIERSTDRLMTKDEQTFLLAAGIDTGEALKRLMGKEHILLKYLRRFPDDKNYENLLAALSENDLTKAFKAVHTLKGAASNVGVISVYNLADPLTEKLRAASSCEAAAEAFDYDAIAPDVQRLGEAFQTACRAILSLNETEE